MFFLRLFVFSAPLCVFLCLRSAAAVARSMAFQIGDGRPTTLFEASTHQPTRPRGGSNMWVDPHVDVVASTGVHRTLGYSLPCRCIYNEDAPPGLRARMEWEIRETSGQGGIGNMGVGLPQRPGIRWAQPVPGTTQNESPSHEARGGWEQGVCLRCPGRAPSLEAARIKDWGGPWVAPALLVTGPAMSA